MRPALPCFLLATALIYMPIIAGGAEKMPIITDTDDSTSLSESLTSGKLIFNLRPRYENVEQTGKETGDALTMRTLLGWKTGTWKGWSGMAEIINVGRANNDYFSFIRMVRLVVQFQKSPYRTGLNSVTLQG